MLEVYVAILQAVQCPTKSCPCQEKGSIKFPADIGDGRNIVGSPKPGENYCQFPLPVQTPLPFCGKPDGNERGNIRVIYSNDQNNQFRYVGVLVVGGKDKVVYKHC
jgi:hypothetical protein